MDAARALIAEADAAQRAPAAVEAKGVVRDWWVRRRQSAPRRPISSRRQHLAVTAKVGPAN